MGRGLTDIYNNISIIMKVNQYIFGYGFSSGAMQRSAHVSCMDLVMC